MGTCCSAPQPPKKNGAKTKKKTQPVPAPTPGMMTPIDMSMMSNQFPPGSMTPQAALGTPTGLLDGGGTTPQDMASTPNGGVTPTGMMSPNNRSYSAAQPGSSGTAENTVFWDRTLNSGPFPPEVFRFFEDNDLAGMGVLLLMCGKIEIMPVRATTGDIQRTDRDVQGTPCGLPVTKKLLHLCVDSLRPLQKITVPELSQKAKQLQGYHLAVRNVRECVKLLVRDGWVAFIAAGRVTADMCTAAHRNVLQAMKDLGHDITSINQVHADTDYAARLQPLTRTLLSLGAGSLMGGCVALRKSQESRAKLAAEMGIPQEAIHRGVEHPSVEREELRLEKEAKEQPPVVRVANTTAELMKGCMLGSDGEELAGSQQSPVPEGPRHNNRYEGVAVNSPMMGADVGSGSPSHRPSDDEWAEWVNDDEGSRGSRTVSPTITDDLLPLKVLSKKQEAIQSHAVEFSDDDE